MLISDIDREIVRLKEDEGKTYKEIGRLLGIENASKISTRYYEASSLINKEKDDPIAKLDISVQDYKLINRARSQKVKLDTINDLVDLIKRDKFIVSCRGMSRRVESHMIVALEKKLGYRIKDTFELELLWNTNCRDKRICNFAIHNCDGTAEGILVYDINEQSAKVYSEKQLPYDKEEIRSKVLAMMKEEGIII